MRMLSARGISVRGAILVAENHKDFQSDDLPSRFTVIVTSFLRRRQRLRRRTHTYIIAFTYTLGVRGKCFFFFPNDKGERLQQRLVHTAEKCNYYHLSTTPTRQSYRFRLLSCLSVKLAYKIETSLCRRARLCQNMLLLSLIKSIHVHVHKRANTNCFFQQFVCGLKLKRAIVDIRLHSYSAASWWVDFCRLVAMVTN